MVAVYPARVITLLRDGRTWRGGTGADVAWIDAGTSIGRTITAAIPPVFEAYGTVLLPEWDQDDDDRQRHARAVLTVLRDHSPAQPWWLGYLDTGVHDVVFPDSPRVTLYSGWHYVLVEAGPEQAATWRTTDLASSWEFTLPDLLFPADRSWLLSKLWDDDWACIGGTAALVDAFVRHPDLRARAVALGEDATPLGHEAI